MLSDAEFAELGAEEPRILQFLLVDDEGFGANYCFLLVRKSECQHDHLAGQIIALSAEHHAVFAEVNDKTELRRLSLVAGGNDFNGNKIDGYAGKTASFLVAHERKIVFVPVRLCIFFWRKSVN